MSASETGHILFTDGLDVSVSNSENYKKKTNKPWGRERIFNLQHLNNFLGSLLVKDSNNIWRELRPIYTEEKPLNFLNVNFLLGHEKGHLCEGKQGILVSSSAFHQKEAPA